MSAITQLCFRRRLAPPRDCTLICLSQKHRLTYNCYINPQQATSGGSYVGESRCHGRAGCRVAPGNKDGCIVSTASRGLARLERGAVGEDCWAFNDDGLPCLACAMLWGRTWADCSCAVGSPRQWQSCSNDHVPGHSMGSCMCGLAGGEVVSPELVSECESSTTVEFCSRRLAWQPVSFRMESTTRSAWQLVLVCTLGPAAVTVRVPVTDAEPTWGQLALVCGGCCMAVGQRHRTHTRSAPACPPCDLRSNLHFLAGLFASPHPWSQFEDAGSVLSEAAARRRLTHFLQGLGLLAPDCQLLQTHAFQDPRGRKVEKIGKRTLMQRGKARKLGISISALKPTRRGAGGSQRDTAWHSAE